MTTSKERLPGHYHMQSVVSAPVADDKGGPLRGHERYVVDTFREDGQWRERLEWIDHEGIGHRVQVPHAVMDRIFTHRDSIMRRAKRDRSLNAAATRKRRQREDNGNDDELQPPELGGG